MSVRIVELARHDTRSLTRAVRNDIALLKECEVYACVAAINITPLTGGRCLLRSRAINMSLRRSEEHEETIRFQCIGRGLSSLRRSEMFIDAGLLDIVFAPLGAR
jgi:hypothetical protein